MVPIWSATIWAAAKSGEPSNPTEKSVIVDKHQQHRLTQYVLSIFLAIAEVTEESNPPESKTP
jgi:hypothetical protein